MSSKSKGKGTLQLAYNTPNSKPAGAATWTTSPKNGLFGTMGVGICVKPFVSMKQIGDTLEDTSNLK
jgi:hypothetical protein